jgi:hypothetical protein
MSIISMPDTHVIKRLCPTTALMVVTLIGYF